MLATKKDLDDVLGVVETLSRIVHQLYIDGGGSNFEFGEYVRELQLLRERIRKEVQDS